MVTGSLLSQEFDHFLESEAEKEMLRFTTAGSVDDGKSTLIGRLLHDAKGVYEDQLASVKKSRINRSGGPIDFSLLTDGLRAEREQGITIDVAYRYFATARRKFIIADTPGHEQYTRNMATGASTANLAVILIDATKGLLPQTRRHTFIASLLGIPNVLAAINKMDLVNYREDVFLRLQAEFRVLAEHLKISTVQCVPISALEGDNVVARSRHTSWYTGPTLLGHLETVHVQPSCSIEAIRFPIQYVLRPDSTFRGYAGQVAGGVIRPGDSVMTLPSRRSTRVQSIVSYDGQLEAAVPSQSVTLKLEDEIDLGRGDMLVSPHKPPAVSGRFSAMMIWFHEKCLELNHTYLLKHTTKQVKAEVVRIRHRVDVNNLERAPAKDLEMNGIALVEVETSHPLFFDAYELSRTTGSFILIDQPSNATVAAGMICDNLSNALPCETQPSATGIKTVTAEARFGRQGHRSAVFFILNRDSLAQHVEQALFGIGFNTVVLNGDEIPSSALGEVLKALWSAGLVIVYAADTNRLEVLPTLKAIAQNSFFDFTDRYLHSSEEQVAAQIVLRAESLRLDSSELTPGKAD
jgi:bifunctional enzyme CysN/CysC/sulfate adenylyltransferase subunit 1